MVNRPQRTPEQQEYRDNLAHDLKELRKYGDTWRELAKILFVKEQEKEIYQESTTGFLKYKAKEEENAKEKKENAKNNIIEWIDKCLDEKDFDKLEMLLLHCGEWWVDGTIAERLIEEWQAKIVVDNLKKRDLYRVKQPCKFAKLSVNVAEKLIEQWYQKDILYSIDDFEMNDHILELLMQYYNLKGNTILREIYGNYICSWNFRWLSKETFETFARNDIIWVVGESIDAFEWLDKHSLLILLKCYMTFDEMKILSGWIKNKKFGLLDNEVALKLPTWIVGQNFELFEWLLDLQIAKDLIKAWYWSVVAKHPEKFWLKKEK